MTAARLLRYARRRAGLSQRSLASAAGVPQSTVARIEIGTWSPGTDTLERLLAVMNQQLTTEPVAGAGVDRSQIREMLNLNPGQRVRRLTGDARAIRVLSRGRIDRRS